MSEQDLRDCMQQAVRDEPPMDFDPDVFMARAEQLTKRRRALVSVGVATALIIATVATLPAFLTSGRNRTDSATSVTATTPAPTSATFPWPPNDALRKNHTYEQDQPYLEHMWVNFLSPALQRQGAELGTIGNWSPTYQRTGFERDGSVSDVLFGAVSYNGPSGAAQLTTTIAGAGAWEPSPDELCEKFKDATTCNTTRKSDGSMTVSLEVGSGKASGDGFYSGTRTVYHYRLDGSVVAMASTSAFVDGTSYGNGRIPLNFDQLAALATDEAIALPD